MMLLSGQSNRIWHFLCGRHPGSVGVLLGPSYFKKVPIDDWMPFALDNDAFTCWRDKKPWGQDAWLEMLRRVKMRGIDPIWAAVPDVVGNREATLSNWPVYSPVIKRLGWNTALCVQDGMTPDDVPDDADVIFVGGTDGWKFPNLRIWTTHFPHVHCARVSSAMMLESCEKLGCESVDSTAWFREPDRPDHLPMVRRFIEGHRNRTPEFSFLG